MAAPQLGADTAQRLGPADGYAIARGLSVPRTARSTLSAASRHPSCSQTTMTCQPAFLNSSAVCRSRDRVVSIFAAHQLAFRFGVPLHALQPCQKQPRTSTATRAPTKTMSTVRRRPATGLRCSRYRKPRRYNSRRNASSGAVSRVRWRLIARRTAAVGDSSEPARGELSATCGHGDRLGVTADERRRQCIPDELGRGVLPATQAETMPRRKALQQRGFPQC